MTLAVRAVTLYNTLELARTTCLATLLEDIMAGKLAEERFCSKKISYLQDFLVTQQSQSRAAHLSTRAY